jgi:putative membrane-bound dehydrogenase-like protein
MRLPGSLCFVSMVVTLVACLESAAPADEPAQWIWSPGAPSQDGSSNACHFRKAFQVPAVRQGMISIGASDRYELYVNGRRVGSGESSDGLDRYEISRFLTRGRNLVAIRVESTDSTSAGLVAHIQILDQTRQTHQIVTDDTWVTSLSPLPFWYTPLYNDSRWETAQRLASEPRTSAGDGLPTLADRDAPSARNASRRRLLDENRSATRRTEVADEPRPATRRTEVADEPRLAARRTEVADEPRPASRRTEVADEPRPATGVAQVMDGNRLRAGRAEVGDDDQPTARAEVEDASRQNEQDSLFRVPIDFGVERLLDQEATGSLLALTFNEFGHIIASREGGELLLIHDSNGDGKPDKVRVYSDQVKDCHGILCLNGSVYVTGDGPDGRGVYRLQDQNRDGSADQVQTLLMLPVDASHAGPHGLTLGSDGLLYVVLGNRTPVPQQIDSDSPYRDYYEGSLIGPRFEVPGRDHDGLQAPGGIVLRMDIRGQRVETIAGGLRDAYSLAFNREGDLFTLDGDEEADLGTPWYQLASLYHVTAGAEFGWRRGGSRWPAYYPDRLPAVLDTGRGAPAGMAFYHHYVFPTPYHDALFVADWSNGQIVVFTFQPSGASYAAERAVFVENDSRSISDVEVGPDGSLYFATGGGGTVGGLYRVLWAGEPTPGAMDLGTGLDAVIRQPQVHSAWSRQKIAAQKKELGAEWDRLLPAVAASAANPWQYRVRALELMQLYGPAPPVKLLVKIAQDEDERVRGKAAEWMGLHPDEDAEQILVQLLADSDAQVRRRACEALRRAGQTPPVDALIPLLKSDDAWEVLAARRLLESMPVGSWRDRLLTSDDHCLLIQGSLALMTADPTPEHARSVLDKAHATMQTFVSDQDFLDLLRVVQVTLLQGQMPVSQLQPLRAQVAAEFPSGDPAMNHELIRLLVHLEIPGMEERVMEYLDADDVAETDKLPILLHLGLLTAEWTPEQRMHILEFFERVKQWPGGAAYAACVAQASDEFLESMTHEELRLALVDGNRWPRAAFALLYQIPEQLDAEMLQTLKQLDSKILDSIAPDVYRLKVGVAAVLARSGDEASMQYLRDLWDLDPERRLAIAMGLAQQPNEQNWHYLIRSLSVLDGGAAKEVLVNLRSIQLAPEEPEFYRHVILRGLSLGERGGEEAVALLEFWTGVRLNGEGDPAGVADTLAAWQAWYAEKWPESPPAELPRYRLHGVWDELALADT